MAALVDELTRQREEIQQLRLETMMGELPSKLKWFI